MLEHLLCVRLGWGQRPKQLVPQEMAQNSHTQGVSYGTDFLNTSTGLGTAQIITVPDTGRHGTTIQVQRPKPVTQQDLPGLVLFI